jgi:hypothetical protein
MLYPVGIQSYIRFGFLTGVTKIGEMSVFSGLNNIQDISMDARYADICGITEAELKQHFGEIVTELAAAGKISVDECYAKLAKMYDGYHFCEDKERLSELAQPVVCAGAYCGNRTSGRTIT